MCCSGVQLVGAQREKPHLEEASAVLGLVSFRSENELGRRALRDSFWKLPTSTLWLVFPEISFVLSSVTYIRVCYVHSTSFLWKKRLDEVNETEINCQISLEIIHRYMIITVRIGPWNYTSLGIPYARNFAQHSLHLWDVAINRCVRTQFIASAVTFI